MPFEALYVSDNGETSLLEASRSWRNTLLVRLYQNDWDARTAPADEGPVECDFPGYAAQGCNWGMAYTNAGGAAQSDSAPVSFTRSTSGPEQLAHGYYLTDSGGRWVWAARRIDETGALDPFSFTAGGATLTIAPSLRGRSA